MQTTEKEFNTTKKKVLYFLEKHPETRDNDKLLILAVLVRFHGLKENVGSYRVLKEFILKGGVPAFSSIVRVRAKLQEEIPTLRGKEYEKRHKRASEVSSIMQGKLTNSNPITDLFD